MYFNTGLNRITDDFQVLEDSGGEENDDDLFLPYLSASAANSTQYMTGQQAQYLDLPTPCRGHKITHLRRGSRGLRTRERENTLFFSIAIERIARYMQMGLQISLFKNTEKNTNCELANFTYFYLGNF